MTIYRINIEISPRMKEPNGSQIKRKLKNNNKQTRYTEGNSRKSPKLYFVNNTTKQTFNHSLTEIIKFESMKAYWNSHTTATAFKSPPKKNAFWTNTSFFKMITMVMSYMFSEPKFDEDSKKMSKIQNYLPNMV